MTHLATKFELLDHTTGQKQELTLDDFLIANEGDEEFCQEALDNICGLTSGESWFFAPGVGDNYEIRRAA